jgi:hypothetical protein
MKQIYLKLIFFFILFATVFTVFWLYLNREQKPLRSSVSVIPSNAFLVLETNDFLQTITEIEESEFFKYFSQTNTCKDIAVSFIDYESIVQNKRWLKFLLKSQEMAFSLHPDISGKSNFLISVNAKSYIGKVNISKLSKSLNLQVESFQLDSLKFHSISEKASGATLYLTDLDNLFLVSNSLSLIKQSIKRGSSIGEECLWGQEKLLAVFNPKTFNIYLDVSKVYGRLFNMSSTSILNGLAFSSLGITIDDDVVTFEGYSAFDSSLVHLYSPLLNSSPGERTAEKIIPSNALTYINFNVENFNEVYCNFLRQYARYDPIGYATYMGGLKLSESFFCVNFNNDIFSWVDGEIALADFTSVKSEQAYDFILAVKTSDVNLAKQRLHQVSQKMEKLTSVRFKKYSYKGYGIHFLNIHGFFRMILGDLIDRKEKPYYTFIDDFVIFSNSTQRLKKTINSYLQEKTMEESEDFQIFTDNCNSPAQVTAYRNMKLSSRYTSSESTDKTKSVPYELLGSIKWIGIQIYPENKLLKTKVVSFSNSN